jgi:hypothetical protein
MSRSQLVAAAALLLACALPLPSSCHAQSPRGEEGTGGAAGYSPPIDMPDANAPMQSRSIEVPTEAAPEPDQATPPDASEKKRDDEGTPKDNPTKGK